MVGVESRHSRERKRYGRASGPGRVEMVLLYLSIPIMIIAVAIATVPLLGTMWRQERAHRAELAIGGGGTKANLHGRDEEFPVAA